MKNYNATAYLSLPFLIASLLFTIHSCTPLMDKKISEDTIPAFMSSIEASDTLSSGKKKFIKEALSVTPSGGITYNELLKIYSHQFDSAKQAVIQIEKVNRSLDSLITEITEIIDHSSSKYKGSLMIQMKLNNTFQKDILYAVLNYRLVDKYDTEYFDVNVKITDNSITGDVLLAYTIHEFDDVANALYTKVPANEERRKALFREGLTIKPVQVVFKDKSEAIYRRVSWPY